MVELRFRIRNSVFTPPQAVRRSTIRPLALMCPSIEEAALLGEVDSAGRLIPRKGVFFMSSQRTGPVIEGFEDCALGEFVKAQLEALAQNGEPPARCEVHGLDLANPIDTRNRDPPRPAALARRPPPGRRRHPNAGSVASHLTRHRRR